MLFEISKIIPGVVCAIEVRFADGPDLDGLAAEATVPVVPFGAVALVAGAGVHAHGAHAALVERAGPALVNVCGPDKKFIIYALNHE